MSGSFAGFLFTRVHPGNNPWKVRVSFLPIFRVSTSSLPVETGNRNPTHTVVCTQSTWLVISPRQRKARTTPSKLVTSLVVHLSYSFFLSPSSRALPDIYIAWVIALFSKYLPLYRSRFRQTVVLDNSKPCQTLKLKHWKRRYAKNLLPELRQSFLCLFMLFPFINMSRPLTAGALLHYIFRTETWRPCLKFQTPCCFDFALPVLTQCLFT